jgi:hypothetical protein
MKMDMQNENGHAAWRWTCSMEMDIQHELGGAAWT